MFTYFCISKQSKHFFIFSSEKVHYTAISQNEAPACLYNATRCLYDTAICHMTLPDVIWRCHMSIWRCRMTIWRCRMSKWRCKATFLKAARILGCTAFCTYDLSPPDQNKVTNSGLPEINSGPPERDKVGSPGAKPGSLKWGRIMKMGA